MNNYKHEFVSVNNIIPDAVLDIRYYSNYNFIGKRIDGYEEPIALLTKKACMALKEANDEFKSKGYRIKIFDAYRPKGAVSHFIKWAKDVNDICMKNEFYPNIDKSQLFELGYISKESSHSRGSSVDLTLVDINTNLEIDMGGKFDYFDESSHSDYKEGLSDEQLQNKFYLQNIMIKHGFVPIKEEWWHFTLKDEPFPDTYFDFPIKKLEMI